MKMNQQSSNLKDLKEQLNNIQEDRKAIAFSLLEELEFMQETLSALKAQVREEGAVDLFEQGKQKFLREHPAMKTYNTTIQKYSLLNKQLLDMMPKVEAVKEEDALALFLTEE